VEQSLFKDCYAAWDGEQLLAGNRRIERKWTLREGRLVPQSLRNKANEDEWIAETNPSLPVMRNPGLHEDTNPEVTLSLSIDTDFGIGPEHLLAVLALKHAEVTLELFLRIYPDTPLIRQEWVCRPRRPVSSAAETVSLNGMSLDTNNRESFELPEQVIDLLPLQDLHCSWRSVALLDKTDTNNNLVSETAGFLYPNEKRSLVGSVMILKKLLKPSGMLLVKEAPTPLGQLYYEGADFRFLGMRLIVTGTGISERELESDAPVPLYGTAVCLFDGSEDGELEAMHRYHTSVHVYRPERDFMLMSNTWGDRNKDGRIRESFILEELRAAFEIGFTHVQIDDGWQKGTTKNSVRPGGVWSGYYAAEPDFWQVDPEKFPDGLSNVCRAASERGIEIGLWFSPDSSNDYVNWRKDASTLVHLYRTYGIRYFKLDGIQLESRRGETRMVDMMRTVLKETDGRVMFNQDATAEIRLGYFGKTQYGSIFLENRYTDWHNYFPHWSLRNLWMLSRYVPAQKLQLEFLNVERNRQLYEDDELAPARCGIAYAFAATLFANPLAWMELSALDPESRAALTKLLQVYRSLQSRILGGRIVPIGEEPNGTRWTGFQSIVTESEGYVLVLRERHAEAAATFRLRSVRPGRLQLKCLLKSESRNQVRAHSDGEDPALVDVLDGICTIRLRNPFSFALYTYATPDSPPAAV